ATDQRITEKDDDGKTQVKTFSNVTLEVTPRIAEKISVAQSIGSLSLSLRSIADNTSDLERAVAAGDIKVPAGTNPADEKQMLLAMANRPIDNNTTFSTGGDVSRFQRRTVAASAPAVAQPTSAKPAETLTLSKGTGTLVRLSEPMSDVFVANDTIADVQVRSSTQLYVFGKGAGETTVYATSKGGRVVYAAD